MSAWRVIEIGGVAIAAAIGGAAAAVAAAWALSRLGRRYGTDPHVDGLIAKRGAGAPSGVYDEALRERAERRRERADEMRRDVARVVTKGNRSRDYLRRMK